MSLQRGGCDGRGSEARNGDEAVNNDLSLRLMHRLPQRPSHTASDHAWKDCGARLSNHLAHDLRLGLRVFADARRQPYGMLQRFAEVGQRIAIEPIAHSRHEAPILAYDGVKPLHCKCDGPGSAELRANRHAHARRRKSCEACRDPIAPTSGAMPGDNAYIGAPKMRAMAICSANSTAPSSGKTWAVYITIDTAYALYARWGHVLPGCRNPSPHLEPRTCTGGWMFSAKPTLKHERFGCARNMNLRTEGFAMMISHNIWAGLPGLS